MKLPDLPRAPETDLSRLAVAVIERDDLSAIVPLVDELIGLGRNADAHEIRRALAREAATYTAISLDGTRHWRYPLVADVRHLVDAIMHVVWYDLFDLTGTVTAITEGRKRFAETARSTSRGFVSHETVGSTYGHVGAIARAEFGGPPPDGDPLLNPTLADFQGVLAAMTSNQLKTFRDALRNVSPESSESS